MKVLSAEDIINCLEEVYDSGGSMMVLDIKSGWPEIVECQGSKITSVKKCQGNAVLE